MRHSAMGVSHRAGDKMSPLCAGLALGFPIWSNLPPSSVHLLFGWNLVLSPGQITRRDSVIEKTKPPPHLF